MAELVAILIVDDIILPALTAAREIGRMSGYGQGYMAGLDQGVVERAAQAAREHHERVERMADQQEAKFSSVTGINSFRFVPTPLTVEQYLAPEGDVVADVLGGAS